MIKSAFTVIELMVVLFIIALILAMGIPAFKAISVDLNKSKTVALIESAMHSARLKSAYTNGVYAVRVAPARFVYGDEVGDGQVIVCYSWTCSHDNKINIQDVIYDEHLERDTTVAPVVLPPDIRVGQGLAMHDPKFNNGVLGAFNYDPDSAAFFRADDFLVAFEGGKLFKYPDFDPHNLDQLLLYGRGEFTANVGYWGYEAPFTGEYEWFFKRDLQTNLIVYEWDIIKQLGPEASAITRQQTLALHAAEYYVDSRTADVNIWTP